jgi:hypothetical protein
MKALTLTQPWASLMELGEKEIETRSWYTGYRGPLVIHAAKGFPKWARETADEEDEFRHALGGLTSRDLPLSQGLCVVELLACVKTTELHKIEAVLGRKMHPHEETFGDYSDGRFAWVTRYLRHIKSDQLVKGALGLWEWPEGIA